MADPTNYEQFNANVTELVQVVQDALKAAYGLENVSHGEALGLLAGLDEASQIPGLTTFMDSYALNASLKKSGSYYNNVGSLDDAVAGNVGLYSSSRPGFPSGMGGYAWIATQEIYNNNGTLLQIAYPYGSNPHQIALRTGTTSNFGEWRYLLSDDTTTVDSNGFIKAASPIFRLANDSAFAQGTGFTDAGAGTANTEAQGVTAEHVGTGVYEVSGSLGLAAEGWQIELPQEPGTGQHLIMAQTEWDADAAVLTVRTFNRQFDVNTASIVPGDPIDIPDGRWLDLRLEMPEPETPEEEATP